MSPAATEVCPGSVKRAKRKEYVVKKVKLLTPYHLRNLQPSPILFYFYFFIRSELVRVDPS